MELWLFGVRWPDACNWFKSFKLGFSQKEAKMLSEWFIVPATSDRMRLFPGEIPRTIPVRFITINKIVYSRTSRKRSPKMPRISSRSREVAAYKNRTGVDRWSLMGEGRLREVVAREGSTVLFFSLRRIHVFDTSITIRNGSINKLESRLAYENRLFQALTGGKTSKWKARRKYECMI